MPKTWPFIIQEAQSAQQENRALKTKVHLAEQAQKAARGMEQDYAEVIRLLEKEVAQLKTHTKVGHMVDG